MSHINIRSLVPAALALMLVSAVPSALAQSASSTTPVEAGSGQSITLDLEAAPQGGQSYLFGFSYPGDSSTVGFRARVTGLDPSYAGAIGFNVFDNENQAVPLQAVTALSNQTGTPGELAFNYSSAKAGPVTLQLFDWAPQPLAVTVTPVNLASGITLRLLDQDRLRGRVSVQSRLEDQDQLRDPDRLRQQDQTRDQDQLRQQDRLAAQDKI